MRTLTRRRLRHKTNEGLELKPTSSCLPWAAFNSIERFVTFSFQLNNAFTIPLIKTQTNNVTQHFKRHDIQWVLLGLGEFFYERS